MRVLVCGGRNYDSWLEFTNAMILYVGVFRGPNPNTTIIAGEAIGADFLAKVYAKYVGFSYEGYPAEWKQYGNRAEIGRAHV